MISKLLREPLLHFLVLGALIFALYGWLNRDLPAGDEIVVTRGQQEHLVNVFTRTWQRPPTEDEFRGLVQDYIREEIAFREGVAMGFDEGDTVIRRRMRQKLELLTDEIVSISEPSDEDLQAFLDENQDRFRIEATFDLRHIFISRDRRGASAEADANALLDKLRSNPETDWTAMGDPLPIGDEFRDVRTGEVERQFGPRFVERILEVEQDRWVGPVESGFGLHLVRIENFVPARDASLDEVRQQITSEWFAQRREAATDELYNRLAEHYTIEIEPLSGDPDS